MSAYIIHELDTRLRIRCPWFYRKDFDPSYMEAILAVIPGVEGVRVNPVVACVIVHYNGEYGTRKEILSACGSVPEDAFQPEKQVFCPANPFTLLFLGAAALIVRFLPYPAKTALSFAIAFPTIARGILTFFSRGLKVEVLDAAVVIFCLMRRDFFTSNAVVFLLASAEYLEDLSEDRSTSLLKNLLKPGIEDAWVSREGQEVSIPVSRLAIGDVVICGPGDTVPVDGDVMKGEGLVDQSSITGESVPVHVEPGDDVLSGSVVSEGKLYVNARKVGADTSMARINRYLEQSLRVKSSSQKKSEKLADKLVPITFVLGTGIYALTGDVSRAGSVLAVDYSCSIKLANPVTVKTFMYVAARRGVLMKGAAVLESLADVDTMVFDKTGTLTTGRLGVDGVKAVGSYAEDEVLSLAAGAEQHYSHPVAVAVVDEAKRRNLPIPGMSQVDFVVAHGVSAYVRQQRILVGSRHFIEEDEGVDCSVAGNIDDLYAGGNSLLFVARGSELAGIVVLRDKIRSETRMVLRELKQSGVRKIIVLTGDHKNTALALKEALWEIDDIRWELKPEEKAAILKELKAQGNTVCFIGDGVNDAPALISADVGICMPAGSDLAKSTAQVLLMKEDLRGLITARQAAVRCRGTIENSFWGSVGLNTLCMVLALSGRVTPVVAAALHNITTIGTTGYCVASGLALPEGER